MLPVKLITINGDRKTHRNKAKPWWSQNLTDLWKLRCGCEKLFCESNFNNRAIRHEQFVNSQKSFDKAVRTAKKCYWYQQQAELLVINQKSDFWKRFGQIGIIQSKKMTSHGRFHVVMALYLRISMRSYVTGNVHLKNF